MHAPANDLDYLSALLHGRRSRLAEGRRLGELSRLQSIAELGRAGYPQSEIQSAVELQRRLAQDLAGELSELRACLSGTEARLLGWVLTRFQLENLKILLRGMLTRTPFEVLQPHLVALPRDLALESQALATAGSLAEFVRRVPRGPLVQSLKEAGSPESPGKAFFLEATLDHGYLRELVARTEAIAGEDKEVVQALMFQEVDLFHLRLVARGRFLYALAPAALLPLHVKGAGISRTRFLAMLRAPDLLAAARNAVGRAVDALPNQPRESSETGPGLEPAKLEVLGWERLIRLAHLAFRRSAMGLGTVLGYATLRRMEVANLITLSEGIRGSLAGEVIRAHLLPRGEVEALHV